MWGLGPDGKGGAWSWLGCWLLDAEDLLCGVGPDLPGAEEVQRGPSGPAADAETMVLLQDCLPGGTCSSSYIALQHEKDGE